MGTTGVIERFARRLAGRPVDRALNQHVETVEAVNALEPALRSTSETKLRERAGLLMRRARSGTHLDDILIDLFALVREVARREVGMRPFDVQVIGGLALHKGEIVQMQTGEGKTLAAVSPVVLHALGGLGVHVLTFNDYLARRDAEWMGPIYRFLGLTVAFIEQGMGDEERRDAYRADVTYLTAKQAGFDFLRDGLALEAAEQVLRPFHAAVVDEADSILIDEARVPLVIAGAADRGADRDADRPDMMRTIVEQLAPGADYSTDDYGRDVYLTEAGANRAEELLGRGSLYAPANLEVLTELNLAVHAEALMRRDVDYIVRYGRIEVVDDFTGRAVKDRHWPDGLQAAIEAKEDVPPSDGGRELGSIALQHLLRQYPHLCGMTATIGSAAEELVEFYDLEVMVVPRNRPCIRTDHPDVIFTQREAKRRALLVEIGEVHRTGRPILVGTLTVLESEGLAADLRAAGIGCNVLNARRDREEARIIARAGALGAVTISTNMAGRGTDIRLGGRDGGGYEQVAALGGLYVIGTNRHESRRIDDQLRGRAGRQGDPGSSRFFISLEDELLLQYGIDEWLPLKWRSVPRAARGRQREPVDNPVLRRTVARVQRIVEGQNAEIRRTLWRYSHFVEQQRRIFGEKRRRALVGEERPAVLRKSMPAAREHALQVLGEAALHDLERKLMLLAIDECWSEHLAAVAEIRDGIHLAEVGGLWPLAEFQKQAAESFDHALQSVEARMVERFASLDITSEVAGMDQMGLLGPSSTWTYLVDDHASTDRLAASLVGRRNIGFAVGAALTGPLFMLWVLSRRLLRRGRR